jgi:hypothetical protein
MARLVASEGVGSVPVIPGTAPALRPATLGTAAPRGGWLIRIIRVLRGRRGASAPLAVRTMAVVEGTRRAPVTGRAKSAA